MDWQPIETAPKDGESLVLWCEKSEQMILDAAWKCGQWREFTLDGYDNLSWRALEPWQKPTHWMRIVPPQK
jgi:hypothetical protein